MFRQYIKTGLILSVLVLVGCNPGSNSGSSPPGIGDDSGSAPTTRDDGPVNVTPTGGGTLVDGGTTAAITSQPLRVELNGTNAQLTWPETAQASSYQLEINGENGYQTYLTFIAGETRHLELMLETNVLYDFQVTAYDTTDIALARYSASARINYYAQMISDETNP